MLMVLMVFRLRWIPSVVQLIDPSKPWVMHIIIIRLGMAQKLFCRQEYILRLGHSGSFPLFAHQLASLSIAKVEQQLWDKCLLQDRMQRYYISAYFYS